MDAFAREVASVVHKHAPNWLIFVQGTANSPEPIAIIDGAKVRTGLGDNLMGAMARPLELAARERGRDSRGTAGGSAVMKVKRS